MRLRQGRSVGRTLYSQLGDEQSDRDVLVGLVDTSDLAAEIVQSVNGFDELYAGLTEMNRLYRLATEQLEARQADTRALTAVRALLDAEEADKRQADARERVGDVRCMSCDLRYEERQQYGCHDTGRAHRYDERELAEEGALRDDVTAIVTTHQVRAALDTAGPVPAATDTSCCPLLPILGVHSFGCDSPQCDWDAPERREVGCQRPPGHDGNHVGLLTVEWAQRLTPGPVPPADPASPAVVTSHGPCGGDNPGCPGCTWPTLPPGDDTAGQPAPQPAAGVNATSEAMDGHDGPPTPGPSRTSAGSGTTPSIPAGGVNADSASVPVMDGHDDPDVARTDGPGPSRSSAAGGPQEADRG